jgi:four helix bundle protein
MPATFEDLRILKIAEEMADSIWKQVVEWEPFPRDVVGKQLARSADSIGANIAESFGRFHFGEKAQLLYYARGSLFEIKYWLNRARERTLIPPLEANPYTSCLTDLARQLNAFSSGLKNVRHGKSDQEKRIRDTTAEYFADPLTDDVGVLFAGHHLNWLNSE